MNEVDWLNQVAHVVIGFVATAALLYVSFLVIPKSFWSMAYFVIPMGVMAATVWREIVWQHPDKCSEGCRTDLLGWLVGVWAGVFFNLFVFS